ncbi:hypothetical protein [Priestia megaterium]|uniref:Uncharacterized protein n=1 Tax=Priestia megaterium TaxID=1404 RepID=A0A6M6DXX6_PRIMG|nr:hypothetical protein [Priestia megaterium]QJX76987.1 hypothetical protein FDZ14_12520 [Priestia megaterium]
MTVKTIKRDAGDQSKGFRLQRLRAINLLLEQMDKNDEKVSVFASTEYLDDVYIKTVTREGSVVLTEGDKNYDESKRFSFMSKEVTNSLIIFLDNWLNCDFSENLFYCFYTNVNYTQERNTQLIKKLEIELPPHSILECLIDNRIDDQIIDCIKKRLIHEYNEQYKDKTGKGYLDIIKKFDDSIWLKFLSRINWQFGQYDDKELEKVLIDKIKNRSFYENIDVTGKEDFIIDILAEKFSSHEELSDPIAKNVSAIHVENIFLKISKDMVKKDDPVYDIWNSLEAPTDARGLKQKILNVDEAYKKYKIGVKARQIAAIKEEYEQLTDQEKGSYRYRVFEACQRKLVSLLDKGENVDVDDWLEEMFQESKSHIEDKSKDYSYPMKSEDAIKGAILELVDSCFLSFDEKGFYYGDI